MPSAVKTLGPDQTEYSSVLPLVRAKFQSGSEFVPEYRATLP